MAIKATNQITITDITDAYSVFMDNEAYAFMADNSGGISGSCVANIKAVCGNRAVTVSVTQANIKFYEQGSSSEMANPPFTATASAPDVNTATITVAAKSNATLTTPIDCVIPISIDGGAVSITKRLTLSAAKTGAQGQTGPTGKGITSVVTYFQRTNTNSAPTAGTSSPWTTTMTAPDASNHYLWAFDYYTYSDSTHSNSTVRLASQYNDANKWYSGTAITGTSTTPTVFSGSGITNAVVNDQYLNTSTGNTYICTLGGNASTAKWKYTGNIKGTPGTNGTDGVDAIALDISANGPTVFKQNTESVTLTPIVKKGATTLTLTAGASGATCSIDGVTHTVKWYKGDTDITTTIITNSIEAQKSGSNFTGDMKLYGAAITNAELITCKLETA